MIPSLVIRFKKKSVMFDVNVLNSFIYETIIILEGHFRLMQMFLKKIYIKFNFN